MPTVTELVEKFKGKSTEELQSMFISSDDWTDRKSVV